MCEEDSMPTSACILEPSKRSLGSSFELRTCTSPTPKDPFDFRENCTSATLMSTPARTEKPAHESMCQRLQQANLDTPMCVQFGSPFHVDQSEGQKFIRTNPSSLIEEESPKYYGKCDYPKDNTTCATLSPMATFSSPSSLSSLTFDHSGKLSLMKTPPRATCTFDSLVDVSPLSSDGTALMSSSSSSSESNNIALYEHRSLQQAAHERNTHVHTYEDFIINSNVYRRKPMEAVKSYNNEPQKEEPKERNKYMLPGLAWNRCYYSRYRLSKHTKLRRDVITFMVLVFLFLYSISVILVFMPLIGKGDVNSLFYEKLKLQTTKEYASKSKLRTISRSQHETSNLEELVHDSEGAITIKKSLGGLHPIYDVHRDIKFEKPERKKRHEESYQIDVGMYSQGTTVAVKKSRPRIFHVATNRLMPKRRRLDFVPTPFSDNTQLYGVLDSDDPALSKMETSITDDEEECVSQAWQQEYLPSCNSMHELDLLSEHQKLFTKQGYWRNAWQIDLPSHKNPTELESFVLKTPKYEHNFEQAHYEHDKIDALAMSKLTFSPFVVNAYAFCGRSVVTEFAGGPRLGSVFDKARKHDLKRLGIARDLATGLSHVHYGKSGNEVQFIHFDINPANVVVIDKNTLRINDFNIAKAIKLNATSGDQCSVPLHQYPNAQWRSPEEVKKQDDLSVKVDVFSLGHIFYRMIVGHEPWNKMEKGGRKPSSDELARKVGAGVLPRIPPQIFESNDKELVAIRKAMMMCYTVDVSKRPTSKAIAKFLDDEWLRLNREM